MHFIFNDVQPSNSESAAIQFENENDFFFRFGTWKHIIFFAVFFPNGSTAD